MTAHEHIRQATLTLPHFNYEVPVLYVEDGAAYVPVRALCQMLGIRADTRIPRWRTLFLWDQARKLPLRTEKGWMRIVWCLHLGAFPLLLNCFDWADASPERRPQMRELTDECLGVLDRAHKEWLAHYKFMRRTLFEFLTTYANFNTRLPRFTVLMHAYLNDVDASVQFEALLDRGRTFIDEATAHARGMLQEMTTGPVIDAVSIDPDGKVIEEFPMPLFPVVPYEDCTCFFEYVRRLTNWDRELTAFLEQHGLFWDKEQKTWHVY